MIAGPSHEARAAASALSRLAGEAGTLVTAEQVVEVAHDRGLGLDRSVCLRDVVDLLRSDLGDEHEFAESRRYAAQVLERQLGSILYVEPT